MEGMDKQKLPLQVLRFLKEIEETIQSSGFDFEKVSNDSFFLSLRPKKYLDFFFNLIKWNNLDGKIIFLIEIFPASAIGDIRKFDLEGSVTPLLNKWFSYLKEYDSIDISSLFPIEKSLQPEEDIYEEQDKILPYCLKSLDVSNFQGIKHTTIENLPVDTQWVFLVGENGFGKSTILQSILLGLNGNKDENYQLVQDPKVSVQVEYKSNDNNLINDSRLNSHRLLQLAAYGPSRLNLQADATISEEYRKSSVAYGLFNSDGALLNIEAKMKDWLLQKDKKRFELVKKAFCKLIPYLADVRFNSATSQIEYLEKDMIDGTETYEPLPYHKLASGFRAIIGLAGDMIVRLSHSQPDIKDPAQLKGIVIIDELDLHWHPKLQKQIPQLFSSVFPKVQFIVSTHSPIPLLGAPHNSVILKVVRTKEEGIKIERVDVELKYLTPNLILTSGIFDMDDVLSVENDDITKTRTEDSFEKMKQNDEIENYLAEFEKGNRQFPDDLFIPKAD
jgi:predicted ATPase